MHAYSNKRPCLLLAARGCKTLSPPSFLVDSAAACEAVLEEPPDDGHEARLLLANKALNFAVIQADAHPSREGEAGVRNAAAEGHDLEQASQRDLRESDRLFGLLESLMPMDGDR